MSEERRKILFIVKSPKPNDDGGREVVLTQNEQEIATRLGTGDGGLGYEVVPQDEDSASALDVRDKALVIISANVDAGKLGAEFLNVAVPVVVTGIPWLIAMKMIDGGRPGEYGEEVKNQTRVRIKQPCHPMAAGMRDTRSICPEPLTLPWVRSIQHDGAPRSPLDRVEIAALENKDDRCDLSRVTLFGYHAQSPMAGGFRAPSKRLHLPFYYGIIDKSKLTADYWRLFGAAIRWAAGEVSVRQFDEVFREEWQEVHRRRELQYDGPSEQNPYGTGFDGVHAPANMVGLALSGGGIRSATFCLGLLQGMQRLKLLRVFDYFSTVSGGGYVGGWWSAWLSRERADGGRKRAAAAGPGEQPSVFPDREKIEPERLGYYRSRALTDRMAEGSLSANHDPIHHLRLFANYLTPRKGALSGDTWRAVTVISRNLMMTWFILLPLLAALILAGQLFFTTLPRASSEFLHPYWSMYGAELREQAQREKAIASELTDERERQLELERSRNASAQEIARLQAEHANNLRRRAVVIALVLAPFAGWVFFMYMAYMRTGASKPLALAAKDALAEDEHAWEGLSTRHSRAHLVGWLGVGLLAFFALALFVDPLPSGTTEWAWKVWGALTSKTTLYWLIPWALVAAALWLYTFPWRALPGDDLKTKEEWRREVWRNRIVRVHSKLLVVMVLAGVALVFSGFGHEIFDYIWRDPRPRAAFLEYVAQFGGWAAFVGAIAGTIFTAVKSAPSAGHDQGEATKSSAVTRFVFAVTPLLLILVLMITLSWLTHEVIHHLYRQFYYSQLAAGGTGAGGLWPLTAISFVGVSVCLFYAVFETKWRARMLASALILGATALTVGGAWLYLRKWPGSPEGELRVWMVRAAAAGAAVILFRAMLKGKRWADERGRFEVPLLRRLPVNHRVALVIFAALCAVLAGLTEWGISFVQGDLNAQTNIGRGGAAPISAFAGLVLCVIFVAVEMALGETDNRRSMVLFATVYATLFLVLIIGFYNYPETRLIYLAFGLLVMALTWVVALGWMSDPNTLSMHAFYRGRIQRAYLGASNPERAREKSQITEAVIGDDLLLSELQNCRRGGPYHLLNTTLNLVGGRDLTTAQRSSAMFVLSKLYCGSFRTGFRRSENYMDGRFSLGTAVAVSGAAVSPGMGSGKTTASLAMLMTLMNVRLGYWAPTPSGEEWASAQARLWPFYMMREFLSQTSDLSSYCYLTDGGHFDNLGLYSLVERGCRYVVVADAVADPEPCFSDLGNAIRRCRIDFGADIDLDITPFIKESKSSRFAKQHYAVGTITYSEEHAKMLGWENPSDEASRQGVIIYIKPSLLKDEKEMRADVRQYEIENTGFPQQSTVDQWFDEAQFESYRKLGEACAEAAFGKLRRKPEAAAVHAATLRTGGAPPGPPTEPEQSHANAKDELAAAINAIDAERPLTTRHVQELFDHLKKEGEKEGEAPKGAPLNGGGKPRDCEALKLAQTLLEIESIRSNGGEH